MSSKGTAAAGIVSAWCRTAGLPEPVREFVFAAPRRWRFDLAFPVQRVAVEFQGGVWTGGRHTRGTGFQNDCEKLSVAASMGWRVLPVTYDQLKSGAAFGWIEAALTKEMP